MARRRCLIISVGTAGDTLPYVGLGAALRSAGHDVAMATNEVFKAQVERAGLHFEKLGDEKPYLEAIEHPDFWHPIKGMAVIGDRVFLPAMEKSLELAREYTSAGNTLVIAASPMFGVRIAYDLRPFPFVTLHLQPFYFASAHELRRAPGPNLPTWSPMPIKRAYLRFVAKLGDGYLGPPINALRAKQGLAPVNKIGQWGDSPELILGLFPEWFGGPQPDWPPQVRLTGFPLYDQAASTELSEELAAFLADPSPFLVFTLGSIASATRRFFEESVAASQILGCRALLLTGTRTYIPDPLPPNVRHFEFAPFSQVLPRASAVVHHAGIGTTSLALAAGIPQITVPFGHDQFDNAARLERLKVGKSLRMPQYRASKVAGILKSLMESGEVRARCQDYKARLFSQKPYEETLRALEEFAARH